MISIEQIHSFTLVYEHGSYSAAARIAKKERSTIREHVVTLEDTIGVDLFQIEGRQAKPTNAAHKLIHRATNLSKQAKDFELTAFSLFDNPLDKLTLLHDIQIPTSLLIEAIKELKQHYPNILIDCCVSSREQAYQAIEQGRCHIAIMATANSARTEAKVASKYIGNLPLGGYVHVDSSPAKKEMISIDELRLITQYELQHTNEGDIGCFKISNTIEKVSSINLAVARLSEGGWIPLANELAKPWVASGHLTRLNLNDLTRNYRQGVCLFFGLADNAREEVSLALDILNRHAEKYLG